MQYLSHIEKYKAKMQKNLIYPVLRNKALPAHLILKSEGMLFCHHYLCSFPFTNMRKLTVIIWEKIKLHTTWSIKNKSINEVEENRWICIWSWIGEELSKNKNKDNKVRDWLTKN